MTMYGILKRPWKKYIFFFLVYMVLTIILRIIGTETWDLNKQNNILIWSALFCTSICSVYEYSRKAICTYLLVCLLYTSAEYIKMLVGIPLRGITIFDSFVFSVIIVGVILFANQLIAKCPYLIIKRSMLLITYLFFGFFLILPLLFWGYYLVSGQLLSADILLTLFQTNLSETRSYLANQNITRWIISGVLIFVILLISLYRIHKINIIHKQSKLLIVFVLLSLIFLGNTMKTKVMNIYFINTICNTYQALNSFKAYAEGKTLREQKLQTLHDVSIAAGQGGVYVLVIGESESRDHMSLYGYNRENTPWLQQLQTVHGTIVFNHAYSCHTHTVAALTYALSEKNQYNDIQSADAYSIMESAKAAGYQTYWISNQERFSTWDTPVAEIASTADHQVLVNGNAGEQVSTLYYDEALVNYIPDLTTVHNAFIIIHLMGSHQSYSDRYPGQFNQYSGKGKIVDTYDNSILYNDAVLQNLYLKIHNNPDYKAWIYFSDHGDDADANKGHEASKFTFTMAHIPLIMNFSDSFIETHRDKYNVLKNHSAAYWSNDLLYDLLIDLMDIDGVNINQDLDLASKQYNRNEGNLMTMHGQRSVVDDI